MTPSPRRILEAAIADGQFPGAVFAYGTPKVQHIDAVGARDDSGAPTTPNTRYDLASLTKPLGTLTAVLRLIEAGHLGLDEPVGRYISNAGWFQTRSLADLRIRALLTHSSGLPAWKALYAWCSDRPTCVANVLQTEPGPPGAIVYSDLGFLVLGALVERVTRQRQDEVLQPVYAALGSGLRYGASEGTIAPTEDCGWRNRLLQGEVHDENAFRMEGVAGHAGLFGSAADVAVIARAWLEADPKLVSPALQAEARRCHVDDGRLRRGLGWLLKSEDPFAGEGASSAGFGHTGYTGCSLWIEPDAGWYGALLTNRVHPTRRRGGRMHQVRQAFYQAIRDELG